MDNEADDFLEHLERSAEETPIEAAGRHYSAERTRYATQEALSQVARSLAKLSASHVQAIATIGNVKDSVDTIKTDLGEVRGWLRGTVTEDGKPTEGTLLIVKTLWSDRVKMFALVGVGVSAVLAQVAITIATTLHLIGPVK